MKFSLKDLMWSVTLACLGLATLMAYLDSGYAQSTRIVMLFLIFPLFGAAIGKLLQQTKKYLGLILIAEAFWLLFASVIDVTSLM